MAGFRFFDRERELGRLAKMSNSFDYIEQRKRVSAIYRRA